jgi:hypothetical protein
MLPFGVTIPATVPQGSENPEGLTNNPVCTDSIGLCLQFLKHSLRVVLELDPVIILIIVSVCWKTLLLSTDFCPNDAILHYSMKIGKMK